MSRPSIGIIIEHQRHAYRVLEVREPLDSNYLYEVIVERLTGHAPGTHHGMRIKNQHKHWREIGEHYAVCNCCNELPPCSGIRAERAVQQSVEAMKVPDGYCPACKEPITHRQKKYVFPGPNLLNPFGVDGVQFHQRSKCQSSAAAYEEKWVKADPTRARSLLTLTCPGHVIVHHDGTGECHRADGESCPHIHARHQSYSACYTQSHGCVALVFDDDPDAWSAHGCFLSGCRCSRPARTRSRASRSEDCAMSMVPSMRQCVPCCDVIV